MAKDGGKRSGGIRKDCDLSTEAEQWPTPCADDSKVPMGYDTMIRKDGMSRMDRLPNNVQFFRLDPQTHDGPTCSSDGQNLRRQWATSQAFDAVDLQRSQEARNRALMSGGCANLREQVATGKKRLNPIFVEWLMGFPINWSDHRPLSPIDFERWGTQSSLLVQQLLSQS